MICDVAESEERRVFARVFSEELICGYHETELSQSSN